MTEITDTEFEVLVALRIKPKLQPIALLSNLMKINHGTKKTVNTLINRLVKNKQ